MIHVTLFGSGQRTVEIPTPTGSGSIPIPTTEDASVHRKAVFACIDELLNRFRLAGVGHGDYWSMVKHQHGITSRKELTACQWAMLSANLNACRRDPAMFDQLVREVKAFKAPLTDATPVSFAEADEALSTCFVIRRGRTDSTETLVYLGEFTEDVRPRCQDHANTTKCIVQLFYDGQPPEPFYPTSEGRSPL